MSEKPTYEELERRIEELEQALCERKQAEESETRFRVAQEMSPDGFAILNPVRNE